MKSLKLLTDKKIAQDFLLDVLGKKINITFTGFDIVRRFVDIYGTLEDGLDFMVRINEAEDNDDLHLAKILMFDAYSSAYERTGNFYQIKSIVFLKYDKFGMEKHSLKTDWCFKAEETNIHIFEDLISLTTLQCCNQEKYKMLTSERKIYEWSIFFSNPADERIQNIILENEHIRYAYNKYNKLNQRIASSQ